MLVDCSLQPPSLGAVTKDEALVEERLEDLERLSNVTLQSISVFADSDSSC